VIAPLDDSALRLERIALAPGTSAPLLDADADQLLYVASGAGLLSAGELSAPLTTSSAGLVLAGEDGLLEATAQLDGFVVTIGASVDRHAPLGPRDLVVGLESAASQHATGSRSFQILFGPHNGSTRATLFAGFIPPGKAPWHYHLYDEIVWVPEGPGRLHLRDSVEELGAGAAFPLRPRQVHIVENLAETELTIIGVFTPAGSPSAAYLEPGVAAEYSFAG
jgi:quercetin dioxygenase-like cupin family protein